MKNRITLFLIGFVIWMLLGWPFDIQHAVVGIFAAGLVAFLTGDLFSRRPHHFSQLSRYFWFCYFVPLFLWECLKADVDMARRVLDPKMPINPGIVKVRTTLKSDTGLAFLANSIMLAPGTFCVDIDPKEGILYIHWIDVGSEDMQKATQLTVTKFETVLKMIFE